MTAFKVNNFSIVTALCLVFVIAFWLDKGAVLEHDYQGLPPVSCIDTTQKILQNFTFRITILDQNHPVEIPDTIGHDPGKCIRVIYTKDTSGTVYVTANDRSSYTLKDFFEVWHKNFDIPKFDDQDEVQPHAIVGVSVNGKLVSSGDTTQIHPGDNIIITYN